MRYIVCLIAGLLVGALFAMTLANALQRRNAWPRAVMTVMQHELVSARDAARSNRCTTADNAQADAHLDVLGRDLERAFADDAQDRVFKQYAEEFRAAVRKAASTGTDCASRATALTEVANACEACHRDYR
jgi:cytochrome c556